jgi:hypothetical protein
MVKPWVDPVTLDKMTIMGGGFTPTLLQTIEPDQLPQVYGGTLDAPLPGGPGGEFPFSNEDGSTLAPVSLTLSRRSRHDVELVIAAVPTTLSWEIVVDSFDIGFAILPSDAGPAAADTPALVPPKLEAGTHHGHCTFAHLGRYVARFDNSFSALRSKSFSYHFTFSQVTTDGD